MSNSYEARKSQVENARQGDGKFGSYEAGESGVSLGAEGDSRKDAQSRADSIIASYEGQMSQEDFGHLRDGAESSLTEDIHMNYNDGMYSEDGEPPEDSLDEAPELDENSRQKLDDAVEDFASDNYAGIKALSETTGRDMESLGHDIYMHGAGHGVGFNDRAVDDTSRDIAQRLSERAQTFEAFEHAELGDDGKVHL